MEDFMKSKIKIGVIGDYDGRPSHRATNEAIRHCALQLGLQQETQWIPTDSLEDDISQSLIDFDALWCAPGSPYKSTQGAMNAIQFARENNYPFIGTCGGFQHAVLEFARDVLDLPEIKQTDFDPYTPNLFISVLSCSLIGETRSIYLTKGTKVAQVYGVEKSEERYNCNFGLNDQFRNEIVVHGFVVAGTDKIGDTRILELPQNNFFIATLFQPQLSSTPENPHKLIVAYLRSAEEFSKRKRCLR
jgi:CTP synthase (UTP-ammonia lyase)